MIYSSWGLIDIVKEIYTSSNAAKLDVDMGALFEVNTIRIWTVPGCIY